MNQINDIIEYKQLIEKYNTKEVHSNNYIHTIAKDLITQERLYYDCSKNNAYLFVKKPVGQRIYYYINDFNEYHDFGNDFDFVTEILFRGVIPQNEINFFLKCGFQKNLVRDQYIGIYKDLILTNNQDSFIKIETATSLEEVKEACELFNSSFDSLSGDFITQEDVIYLLEKKSILIAKDKQNNSFLGALHQEKEGSVNVIGHVAVLENVRGKGIGKALVNNFIIRNMESEKTRYQFWTQRQNETAVKMYKKFGFDFTNKSTISLIKKR